MRRTLSNLAAALSVPLLAAVLLLWARSYVGETVLVESTRGQLLFIGIDGPASDVAPARHWDTLARFVQRLTRPPLTSEHRLLGFLLMRGGSGAIVVPYEKGGHHTERYPFVVVRVPYWFLALLPLGFLVVWVWQARRQRRRHRAGRCLECGYDLRATPDRCPECGTVQPTAGTAA